ncbi:aminoacyl-tRNA hydrolase [Kytococcus sedentarius]|uniref:aminoacyl-tRNA hydrolase n=1 Tax=Kytococcus sedentarius TaxID=1276 RepID=UPI00194EBA01|nr:aminoacyl-tRNA hydrolase [Kytococcus sedentarius]QRO87548.1 aminoacyl-tRNA hydrolase [Kytococcus sedentarius]
MEIDDGPWLVAGLGNPGPRYAGNRHNVGAMVVAEMAASAGVKLSAARQARAVSAETRVGTLPGGRPGPRVVLATPLDFMNLSGGPVSGLMKYHGIDVDHLVVLHDELDIDFGAVRLKKGGGEGGHNGLRSITQSLGTKDYHRIRLGIGRPPGRMDVADFVLRDFSSTERAELPFLLGDGADAVERLLHHGLEAAQQFHHSPR